MRYGAIDIGSNAIRLMIADIDASGKSYKKNLLLRVPLRLGDDAFIDKKLSDRKGEALLKTMMAFKNLMDVYKVSEYMACATSAMREVENGEMFVKAIRRKTGLDIRIIRGEEEASIIYSTHLEEQLNNKYSYLYIDVGGGSTEVTVLSKGKIMASGSFNIGTIRMLDNQDSEETWKDLKAFVKKNTKSLKNVQGIGTGGNIIKLFKLSGEKEGQPLSLEKLKSQYTYLNAFSMKDRINVLGLNQDRADVIIPAAEIFLSVLKWAGAKQIYVPKQGLVDGMIKLLIEKNDEL